MISLDTPVRDIAIDRPGATAVFRQRRIDFCCNGNRSLREAAHLRGVDPEALAAEIDSLAPVAPAELPTDPNALIDHILTRFHETHRRELPELMRLARRVETVHKDHPERPRGLAAFLANMAGELEDHMLKEEAILFPMLRSGRGALAGMPIARMRMEHDDHGEHLETLARLTTDFTPPEGACATWRALFAGCAKLDGDLREHIHLENNVLFPQFETGDASASAGLCGCGGHHGAHS